LIYTISEGVGGTQEQVKKMNAKEMFVVALVLGAIIGAGGTYYYMVGQVEDAFSEGMAYQQSLQTTVSPASITATLSPTTFDHTATVASDGSVSAETTKTAYLTIENTDESATAGGLKILLYNPITSTEGLHDNLETDSTEVGVTIGGVTAKLYHDGDYTNGYVIGDLPAGGEVNVTISFTLEDAVAGTFQDGQSYTCHLYLYQPNANYCDVVSFTVTT